MTSAPSSVLPGLSPAQATWVEDQLGPIELVEDMSWGDIDSTVLRVRVLQPKASHQDSSPPEVREVVIKAHSGGQAAHHFARELSAYRSGAVDLLISTERAASLLHFHDDLGVLILEYQTGHLVPGTPSQYDVAVHKEAGWLLWMIHTESSLDFEWEARATQRALSWLDSPHRIPSSDAATTRRILEWRMANPRPVDVVHTHGDFHPRNWIQEGETVKVIDWGRYERRPSFTDWIRCAAQEWRERPELGDAFAEGYGEDLRETEDWKMEYLRQGVGTACWAPTVGDEVFEAQGLRMIKEALEMLQPLIKRLEAKDSETSVKQGETSLGQRQAET